MSSEEFNQSLFKSCFGDLDEHEQKYLAKIINRINKNLEVMKYGN